MLFTCLKHGHEDPNYFEEPLLLQKNTRSWSWKKNFLMVSSAALSLELEALRKLKQGGCHSCFEPLLAAIQNEIRTTTPRKEKKKHNS